MQSTHLLHELNACAACGTDHKNCVLAGQIWLGCSKGSWASVAQVFPGLLQAKCDGANA